MMTPVSEPLKNSGEIIATTYWLSVSIFCFVIFLCLIALFTFLLRAREIYSNRDQKRWPMEQILTEFYFSPDGSAISEKYSFSRFAGALGAIGFAAVFLSFGLWALCGLFIDESLLTRFGSIWGYLLAASIFFFPYASNQIRQRFQTQADDVAPNLNSKPTTGSASAASSITVSNMQPADKATVPSGGKASDTEQPPGAAGESK